MTSNKRLPAVDPEALDGAVRLISDGYLDEHSVEELARALYVSERKLRRMFERELDTSPLKLAHQTRITRAKELLSEAELPITEVAFASGFRSIRQFNRTFREVLGTAPSKFARAANEHE